MTEAKAPACECWFYEQSPLQHAMLLDVETLTAPWAAKLVVDLLIGGDMNVGEEKQLIDDPDDFGRFVGLHNWKDPVGMFLFAESADWAANQVWHVRHSKQPVS